jgi:transmembrane sensor
MNERDIVPMQTTRTREVKARAAAWLERRDSGNWTEKDQTDFDAWLSEATANLLAYRRVEDVWGRTERLVVLRSPEIAHTPFISRGRIVPTLVKTAIGVLALTILGVAAALFLTAPQTQTYTTAVGGHDTLTLPDGSRIELNTDTAIRVADTTNLRKIWLDKGEVYFQVVHNAARPFVVVAGDRRVTDIGTKFMMRRESDRLQVAVVDGRVRFDAGGNIPQSSPAVLSAGEAVTMTESSLKLTRSPPHALESELGWLRGVFVFRHTTLADAAAEYNRYNAEKILVSDPAVARLTISGTLPTNNVKAFTDVARNFFSLNVVRRGDEVVISR